MKKSLIFLAFPILIGIIAAAVVLMLPPVENYETVCETHKDLNGDARCDVCNTETESVCKNHSDANHDGICDSSDCTETIEIVHTDTNGDKICDSADCSALLEEPSDSDVDADYSGSDDENGAENDPPCSCVDENQDSKCDVCGKTIESAAEFESVSISGFDITGYVIAYDSSHAENEELANEIKSLLYEKAGILLETVDIDHLQRENYIAVRSAEKSGGEGFYVNVIADKNLEIVSEFPNKTLSAGEEYLNAVFESTDKKAKFTESTINVRDVFYKDFGVVGDGNTDDYLSIKEAHDYANEYGHTVHADALTYSIASIPATIEISTSVCWNNAIFHVGDSEAVSDGQGNGVSLFTVVSDRAPTLLSEEDEIIASVNAEGTIKSGAENVGFSLGYAALLIIESSASNQRQTVLIDEKGNVDASTPILKNFDRVSSVYAAGTDDFTITLENATFTAPILSIKVCRSNTTLSGIRYEIKDGPTKNSAPHHSAILSVSNSYNVCITGYSFDAHVYNGEAESYAISVENSLNIKLSACSQSNYYGLDGMTPDNSRKGIFRFAYSNNIVLDRCTLSLFFAENEVYGITIKNCVISEIDANENEIIQ